MEGSQAATGKMAGKRPHGDEADTVSRHTKRPKVEDGTEKNALGLILDHSDELIECLRRLKSEELQRGTQSIKADKELSSLSKMLLPAFQEMASTSAQPDELTALEIPHPAFVTKWVASEITNSLPPLPAVLDPKLEMAALTHSGQHDPGCNYERLEWVGDAYLEVIATALIHQTFPKLPEGKCAQIREILIKNATLSTFTTMYGLDKRANLPEEFRDKGRENGTTASQKMRIKALGDLFEAYVGAIIISDPKDGVQRAAEWLKVLWSQTAASYIRKEEIEHAKAPAEQDLNAKTRLDALICIPGLKIEYRDLPSRKKTKDSNLPLFNIACFLNGFGEDKQVGYGSGLSKKEAGQKAARMALENKKALKPHIERKKAYEEMRRAQRAA